MGAIQPETIVGYANPTEQERNVRFIVLENNGNRLLCQLVCDWPIKPTELLRLEDVMIACVSE